MEKSLSKGCGRDGKKATQQRQIDQLISTWYQDNFVSGYSVCRVRCWFCLVELLSFLKFLVEAAAPQSMASHFLMELSRTISPHNLHHWEKKLI